MVEAFNELSPLGKFITAVGAPVALCFVLVLFLMRSVATGEEVRAVSTQLSAHAARMEQMGTARSEEITNSTKLILSQIKTLRLICANTARTPGERLACLSE